MKNNNKLFLETTIQIGRLSASPEKNKKINKIISQFKKIITSSYVKMEFRRRYIQDLVYLYNVLIETDKFADVFLRIENLHSEYHRRKISGIITSFCNFFSDIDNDKISGTIGENLLQKAISYFRHEIEFAYEDFEDKIDEVIDATGCFHAKTGPAMKGEKFDNRMQRCKKTDIRCKIVDFFIKNKEFFTQIYEKLSETEDLDDEQEKAKRILEKALKHPENMSERESCWHCGDVIIAVESPKDAHLFTTNIKHFEPLCSVLEKGLFPLKYSNK